MASTRRIERRQHPRMRLAPMYTQVTVGAVEGHAYDISESGVRIELDCALEVGAIVEMELRTPLSPRPVAATAQVVWVADAMDDPGPRRMALTFRSFSRSIDAERLFAGLRQRPYALAA